MSIHDIAKDALIACAILNLCVSLAISRSASYTWRQKTMQIMITWLIPVLGAVLLGLFILSQRGNAPITGYPKDSNEDLNQIWNGLHPPDQKQ